MWGWKSSARAEPSVPRTVIEKLSGQPEQLKRIREGGIRLDGRACLPAKIGPRGQGAGGAEYDIALREGKNRQIRRMVEALGRRVRALHRTSFGPITLSNLPVGGWRELREGESHELRSAAGLTDK